MESSDIFTGCSRNFIESCKLFIELNWKLMELIILFKVSSSAFIRIKMRFIEIEMIFMEFIRKFIEVEKLFIEFNWNFIGNKKLFNKFRCKFIDIYK